MAKRPLPSGAFALPGLSKPDVKKPYGLSSTRGDYFSSSSKNLASKNGKASTEDSANVSSSLVDNKGSLLPPQSEHTLNNLTKTRPRSPGRRSPSPLARRKFEHDSLAGEPVDLFNSSLEADNLEKSPKDHNDVSAARLSALKERTTFSPALILTNDVGFSISGSELSVSRTSPKVGNKNRTNRPAVLPKPDRNRNRVNAGDVAEKSDHVMYTTGLISDHKIVDKEAEDNVHMEPPPLPSSPPPLEDDISPSLDSHALNKEVKPLQGSVFGKATKTSDESNFDYDLSTKLSKPIKNPNEVNGLNRTEQLKETPPTDAISDSPSSRIAKWQGYGRTSSHSNDVSGMGDTVAAGLPDRQTSLDSVITSRLSKYETPYGSRQRKPVDKSPSSRRRRFKLVSLEDETENTNSETAVEAQSIDSSIDLVNESPGEQAYKNLHGTQTEQQSFEDSLARARDKRTNVQTHGLNATWDTGHSFQRNGFGSEEKGKSGHFSSPLPSVSGSTSNTEISRQHPNPTDKFGASRTINPEPIVTFEYDGNKTGEKVIEIETNETVPFYISDTRTSNRTEPKEFISQNNKIKSEIKDNNDRNDRLAKQQDSPGSLTLPKVVIEYDGEIISDPLIHGYDTETSDEGQKSMSPFRGMQGASMSHDIDYESESSLPAEDNDVVTYGDYSDEEEDLFMGLEDASEDDEDLTFEDLDSAREEMEKTIKGGFLFVKSKGWIKIK